MKKSHQATSVVIDGRALLIEGRPGAGKSSLALALIDRGAVLVGDDSLMIEAREGRLFAHPHPNTRGLLEVRNLGLLTLPVCEEAPVALAIRLADDAPRYVDAAESVDIAGISLPMLSLWSGSPVLHLRAELALERYGLNFP